MRLIDPTTGELTKLQPGDMLTFDIATRDLMVARFVDGRPIVLRSALHRDDKFSVEHHVDCLNVMVQVTGHLLKVRGSDPEKPHLARYTVMQNPPERPRIMALQPGDTVVFDYRVNEIRFIRNEDDGLVGTQYACVPGYASASVENAIVMASGLMLTPDERYMSFKEERYKLAVVDL